jgi:alkylation response protein AidB-like acyl-CoA dehydrogenase
LARAEQLFADADAALAKKDLGTYAAKVEAARSLVQQAVDALDRAKP